MKITWVFNRNEQCISLDAQTLLELNDLDVAPKFLPPVPAAWRIKEGVDKVQGAARISAAVVSRHARSSLSLYRRLQMLLQQWSKRASQQVKTHPHWSARPASDNHHRILAETRCQAPNTAKKSTVCVYTHLQSMLLFGQNICPSPKPQKWRGKRDSPDNERRGRCLNILGSDFQKQRLHIILSLIQEDWIQELRYYSGATESHSWLNIIRSLFAAYSLSNTHARTCFFVLQLQHL